MLLLLGWVLVYFFPLSIPMWFLCAWVFAAVTAFMYHVTKLFAGY
jgi:hypothetical protein